MHVLGEGLIRQQSDQRDSKAFGAEDIDECKPLGTQVSQTEITDLHGLPFHIGDWEPGATKQFGIFLLDGFFIR